jgi:hypothetical protein
MNLKWLKWLVLFLFAAVSTVRAQGDFRVVTGTEVLLEGGKVEKMSVVISNYQFNVRPPRGWYRKVEEASREIVFTSPSGKSALTIRFTAFSPDALPEESVLRTRVLQDHAGAGIVQNTVCPTAYRPGMLFDLVRVPAPQVMQKIRHAYLPHPAGTTEMILVSSEDEYDKTKVIFMATARAFRVERILRD